MKLTKRLSVDELVKQTGQPLYKVVRALRNNHIGLEARCKFVCVEDEEKAIEVTAKYLM